MPVRTQYVTSDGTVFAKREDAREYERDHVERTGTERLILDAVKKADRALDRDKNFVGKRARSIASVLEAGGYKLVRDVE